MRWIRFSTLAGFPLGRSPSTSPISRRDPYQCCYCNFEKKDFFCQKHIMNHQSSWKQKLILPPAVSGITIFLKKQTSKLEIYGKNQIVKICVKWTVLFFVTYKDVILQIFCASDLHPVFSISLFLLLNFLNALTISQIIHSLFISKIFTCIICRQEM